VWGPQTDERRHTMTLVLIADDDVAVRRLLSVLFHSAGYDVVEAQDGDEALDQIGVRRPDVLLLDLAMPRMSGIEVLDKLADLTDPPSVIVLSASRNAPDVAAAHGVGMLSKPFDVDQLLERVATLVA
jgi:CheY-like chemotaxis protein